MLSPGGLPAVIASAAFAFYVASFGSYNKTYGAVGGVIIFLIWLWLSNIMVLLGAVFNAEIERGRQSSLGCALRTRTPSWSRGIAPSSGS